MKLRTIAAAVKQTLGQAMPKPSKVYRLADAAPKQSVNSKEAARRRRQLEHGQIKAP